ncbi:unnamed protein product [Brassicogethes aeneus]|uniref:Uncharacterized protein n=1 Tax=Brassicogethes aeneus TaxID=1431903 RepID=A0A9P0AYB2_BRAAE|nr:unnamed protein product [Brassicogethes aeneus]
MASKHMPDVIPIPLPDDVLVEIVSKSRDWALMHGAAMRSKSSFSEDSVTFAPFVLLPSSFPKKEFEEAVDIQVILNELVHKVAHDRHFLTTCLRDTIQVDDFTAKLFKIYETIQNEGISQEHMWSKWELAQALKVNSLPSCSGALKSFGCERKTYCLRRSTPPEYVARREPARRGSQLLSPPGKTNINTTC